MSLTVLLFITLLIPVAGQLHRNLTEMLTERFERLLAQLRDQTRSQVLELLAKGAPLSEALDAIVLGLGDENPDMIDSILLLLDNIFTGDRFAR